MRLLRKFNFILNFHIRESNYECPPKEDFSSFRLFFLFMRSVRRCDSAYYRVFNNGYSKHFRDMTSGTKLKKMIKEHV